MLSSPCTTVLDVINLKQRDKMAGAAELACNRHLGLCRSKKGNIYDENC